MKGSDCMAHTHTGGMHSHIASHFQGKVKDDEYDFGWGFVWKWGFFIGWIIFLAAAVGVLILSSSQYLLTALAGVLLLITLMLLLVDIAIRYISQADSELILPFVDLFRSDKDLILDAGCGHGRTSIATSKVMKNGRIVAIDRFDADYIENGGRKLLERNMKIAGITDRVDIQKHDVTDLKFEDGTFDAAVSSYMIDHLGGNDKLKGLKEVNRVLKKNGRFLLMVTTPNFFMKVMRALTLWQFKPLSVDDWNRLFAEAGFKTVSDGELNLGHFFLLEKNV